MSASRHTYLVVWKTLVPGKGSMPPEQVDVMVHDGAAGPAAYGSKRQAESYAAHMRRIFPHETYEVIKLR